MRGKLAGTEHHARVPFAAGADQLSTQGTEVAEIGGYDATLLVPHAHDGVGIRQ